VYKDKDNVASFKDNLDKLVEPFKVADVVAKAQEA
jgi:hypothetical protein